MSRLLAAALTGTVLVAGAAMQAHAADLYEPPVIEYEPPVKYKESYGGWYLRGHIGMSNQRTARSTNTALKPTALFESKSSQLARPLNTPPSAGNGWSGS